MLKLFQSIFGGGEHEAAYPESLIDMATERALDGTDPRLRALPRYRNRLRAPVIHAIDYVLGLVDRLPAPLPIRLADFGADPRLSTLFASFDHVREVFAGDYALSEFRDGHPNSPPITALLLAQHVEKAVLGAEIDGGMLKRDVAQVTVNFCGHRLVDPDVDEMQTRRLLKRRAFDHLLSLALLRITEVRGERAELSRQRDLLRRKLSVLKQEGWSFDSAEAKRPDRAALQTELDNIQAQLAALGANTRVLNAHLDIVIDVLAECQRHFWTEELQLHLDRMNIQRDANDASARTVCFQELHNARGQREVTLLVGIDPGDLPQRVDFWTAARPYLD